MYLRTIIHLWHILYISHELFMYLCSDYHPPRAHFLHITWVINVTIFGLSSTYSTLFTYHMSYSCTYLRIYSHTGHIMYIWHESASLSMSRPICCLSLERMWMCPSLFAYVSVCRPMSNYCLWNGCEGAFFYLSVCLSVSLCVFSCAIARQLACFHALINNTDATESTL